MRIVPFNSKRYQWELQPNFFLLYDDTLAIWQLFNIKGVTLHEKILILNKQTPLIHAMTDEIAWIVENLTKALFLTDIPYVLYNCGTN